MKTKEFLDAIKNDKFVEAHEILEHNWKELKKIDKEKSNFLKGLINGATALALYKKGKTDGAKRIWEAYIKYKPLKKYFNKAIFDEIIKVLEQKHKEVFK